MSDISRELVKCAKCGKESQQLTIYSVNYSLGSEESNDKLVSHKQKCPYCNYKSINIDVIGDNSKNNKKLKREEIKSITDEFTRKIKEYEIFKIPNGLYIRYFNSMKKCFNDHLFEIDDRFVTYGRIDFLKEELTQRLNDESLKKENLNWKEKWDNRLGAFIDLMDVINGNAFFGPHQVPQGVDFKIANFNNNQYYKDGYICKQEKDLILNMINKILEFINHSLEEKEMGLFSKKDKYEINEKDNVPQFVYGIPDFKQKNYDVKPEDKEDNVPQRVYGVSNANDTKPTNNSTIKKSVVVGIKNEKSNYVLSINYAEKLGTYDLLFADLNNLDGKSISDLATPVPEKYYNDFITKLYSIINDWEDTYSGNSNVLWNIKVDTENSQKTIFGKGGYPKNWNKLIDLLSEYERLFKVSKDIELGKVKYKI